MAQAWRIALSPAERWQLLELSHAQGRLVPPAEATAYRRFMEAFGLRAVARVLRRHGGRVRAAQASDETTRALFEITAENLDQARKVLEQPMTPLAADVLGELVDELEALKDGRESASGVFAAEPYDEVADAKAWEPEAE